LQVPENETWGNNASQQSNNYSTIFLSGTEAGPAARLEIAQEALDSDLMNIARLAVMALGSA